MSLHIHTRVLIISDCYQNLWFQQDSATCHTSNDIIVLLEIVFEDRIISRKSDED